MTDMTNAETAAHIRRWVAAPKISVFSWPTDGCGYNQHCAFVEHRNANWHGDGQKEFNAFCLDYAAALETRPEVGPPADEVRP